MNKKLPLIFIIASSLFVYGVTSKNITIENKCDYTVWPGIFNRQNRLSNTTGFALEKGESRVIIVEPHWYGAIWSRTLCSRNSTGKFSCATGDCGSGEIECSGLSPRPMNTTLAEFQMDNEAVVVFYRVNVVYGYNLPLLVVPQRILSGLEKVCTRVGCDVVNLNQACPYELMVVDAEERPIACTNPCGASGCMPSSYSESFKVPCPEATFDFSDDNYVACTGSTDYVITFCPSFTPVPTRRVKSETKIETFGFTNETTPRAKHDDKSPLKVKVIIGISAAALLVMIIILAVSTVVVRAKNARRKSDWSGQNIEAIVMLKRYSYAKVKKMTNSFSHVLGKGGFGTVYKGKLLDGSGTDVAVKVLKDSKGNGEEFINEVASMSRTSHVNIVSLLGFCYEGSKRAIIYEFMPNGSLDKYISESMSSKMEWETLYSIAEGVARATKHTHGPRSLSEDCRFWTC
ncbi:PR5-like receptor kinase [Raphanus sativus]|nr:PR5-like receptor kinase [Raphanus sativus]